MFDILSAVEATLTASILISLLAFSTARTPRGRLLVVWRSRPLVCAGSDSRRHEFAGSRVGIRRPGAGPGRHRAVGDSGFGLLSRSIDAQRNHGGAFAALVAVNATRIIGVSFVILYAEGRLPAPFAPSAGWGDIFVGLTALPLAWSIARFGPRVRPLALLWNAIGFADLTAAIALGALSAPSPFQIFHGPPDSSLETTLPWLIIPCFLVPIYLFIHVAIFTRLSHATAHSPRARMARRTRGHADIGGASSPLSVGSDAVRAIRSLVCVWPSTAAIA